MKRYIRDNDVYVDIMKRLKDKFENNLGHIFVDEILVMVDTEFEVKKPKGKDGDEPDEEAISKWEDKKKKAWKFDLKKIPKLYQDVFDPKKEFVLIVRKSLVEELSDAQIAAYIYTEMRKIDQEYKLTQPDLYTFSDLADLLGRPDWNDAYTIPNILDQE